MHEAKCGTKRLKKMFIEKIFELEKLASLDDGLKRRDENIKKITANISTSSSLDLAMLLN